MQCDHFRDFTKMVISASGAIPRPISEALANCNTLRSIAFICNQVDNRLTKMPIFVMTLCTYVMARITATLSTRVDARGKSEILLRFVGGRDHIYRLHSHLFVAPSRWKDGSIIIPRLETQEQKELRDLKTRLDDLTCYLLDFFQETDQERLDRKKMQEAVELFFHPDRNNLTDFFPLFDEFTEAREIGHLRKKRYYVVRGSLERFQEISGTRLTLDTFTPDVLEAYNRFLYEESKYACKRKWEHIYREMKHLPDARGKNAVIDYLKALRAFFHWAEERGYSTGQPFRGFAIGTAVYGTPYYLTIEERERIYRTNLSRHPALDVQKDIFVFQCLVGCRVGDLIRIKKTDVLDDVLTYIPRKTIEERPAVVRVPLNNTAKEIIRRYDGLAGEKLLPFISSQKYNEALKKIFLAARITRLVAVLDPLTRKEVKRPLNEVASSHLARRTFIGNLYKQVADPNLISAMSGHTDGSKAFARYRDIDDEMKAGLVNMLEAKNKG